MLDGWKNCANRKTVVALLECEEKYVILKSYDSTMMSETGQVLAGIARSARDLALKRYEVTARFIIAENAASIILISEIIIVRAV